MSRGFTFEFEDVVEACDDQVRISSVGVPTESVRRKVWRARHAADLLVDRSESGGDELVFAVAQVLGDLPDHLAFLPAIRSAAKRAAFVEELWIRELPLRPDMRRFLAQFDHVFVSCASTVEPLAEHLETPVTYLAPSVDHRRFAVSPWPPTNIDVYAMGRRHPEMHHALEKWVSSDRSPFYLYDTFVGNPPIADHRQHRDKLADLIRRSRYFVVNGAKVNSPDETGNQVETGYRFFEGAAAGALMVGTTPDIAIFDELFDWEEPVVTVDPSGADIVERILELEEQPERRAGIRTRNVRGSLRAHDPAHRWRTVLECLDLAVPSSVDDRIRDLAAQAEDIRLN